MQVIHDNAGITHAVLGKGETIDFKASTSAQVLFLLSTGLYKYPRLAAVREIICNGWDAHIKASICDIPLKIEISKDNILTVRDFGSGIAHEDIGPIYCTAGDSTKVDSDDETGGFGLGSKAPFAYRDHFGVTSFHNGRKTMYAMAMSDSQSMGKPTAKVLHSSETTESGLMVSLQLKEEDVEYFERAISRVVYQGDINAVLNNKKLDVCGMDKAGSDVSVIAARFNGDMFTPVKLGIRYGAVVYPLEIGDDHSKEFHNLHSLINKKYGGLRGHMLIMRAPAHSVSMVPSREALLYNPRTVQTVIELMRQAIDALDAATKFDHWDHVSQIVSKAAAAGWSPTDMLQWRNHSDWPEVTNYLDSSGTVNYMAGFRDTFPPLCSETKTSFNAEELLKHGQNAHTPQEYSLWYVINNYRDVLNNPIIAKKFDDRLFKIATTFGKFNLPALKRLRGAEVLKRKKNIEAYQNVLSKIVRQYITKPYLRAMKDVSYPENRLFAVESGRNIAASRFRTPMGKNIYYPDRQSVFNAFPVEKSAYDLTQPLALIVWTGKNSNLYIKQAKSLIDHPHNTFFYVITLDRKHHDATAVARSLKESGWAVFDMTPTMTKAHEAELAEKAANRAKYKQSRLTKPSVVRVTKTSLPALSNCIKGNGDINLDNWSKMDAPVLIENPTVVLHRKVDNDTRKCLPGLTKDLTKSLVTLFKDVVGVTNREATYDRFRAAGAMNWDEFLYQEATKAITPTVATSIAESLWLSRNKNLHLGYTMNAFFGVCFDMDAFRAEMGMTTLTPDEKVWAKLYLHFTTSRWHEVSNIKVVLPDVTKKMNAVSQRLHAAEAMNSSVIDGLSNSCFAWSNLPSDAQIELTKFITKFTKI